MIGVAFPEEPAVSLSGLEQHAVASGIWGTIRNTVLHSVDVDPWTKGLAQTFAVGAVNNVLNREINCLRLFPMQQSRRNPDLVCDF